MPNLLETNPTQPIGDSTGSQGHPAVAFLKALFGRAPQQHYLELRPLPTGLLPKSLRFLRLRQLQRRGFDQAVPELLNGKANVFFGVLPRSRKGGKAADVEWGTCVWADLDKGWPTYWPEGLPLPSIVVESSPGKFQIYWLLHELTDNTGQVSALVRRVARALGGDSVADIPRILRLPGFQNLKYPEHPVAALRELHPERRFTLGQLEAALPSEPVEEKSQGSHSRQDRVTEGQFDPHAGGSDVPRPMLAELQNSLLQRGAKWCSDGRLVASCPFPHVEGPCGCAECFLFSPISGRWWCFCTDHPQRDPEKSCVGGGAWSLWGALFPGRLRPRSENGESPASSPLRVRGEDPNLSRRSGLYDPPAPVALEALQNAPRHARTAVLLRSVGLTEKAEDEEHCGVPLKGKCPRPQHGIVRQMRSSGKTPWCAGCNTETSSKYLNVSFPDGAFTILRLQRHLGLLHYDSAELRPGVWEIDPTDDNHFASLISEDYQSATEQFRRIQKRFKKECLGWHFAVGQDQEGLWLEIQVLVRHSDCLQTVLRELTGDTRKTPLFQPDTVIRFDYPIEEQEQLRRDWAGLLKCSLLRLDDDLLFTPIFQALRNRQLSQPYGDLRAAYATALEEKRNGQTEDVTLCPVVEEDGTVCGCELTFFLDPLDQHPLNHQVLGGTRSAPRGGREGPCQ